MDRLTLLGVMSAVLYASRPCETWGPDVREDVMDECELLLDELDGRLFRESNEPDTSHIARDHDKRLQAVLDSRPGNATAFHADPMVTPG